jgi:phospholipid/cholesterol/gamma-HCH transport system ATP-binding protein
LPEVSEKVIEVKDLVVKYGERTVLTGVNLDVRRGETIVVLGGSGSGKSTLLRNMVGLMRPYSGSILLEGKDITHATPEEQVETRKKIGMCFQGSALFGSMSVGENVALPLLEHTDLERSTIDIMVKIKLDLVGLSGFEDYMPAELSGGMRKRAGLARAMAMDPEIIFYDEPSAGLDPIVAAGLDALINKLKHTFNLTSVVVTHELPSVELIADRVCMLHKGKVVGLGTLAEVKNMDSPFIQQFFAREPDDEEGEREEFLKSLTEDWR